MVNKGLVVGLTMAEFNRLTTGWPDKEYLDAVDLVADRFGRLAGEVRAEQADRDAAAAAAAAAGGGK